ncbi:MAG: DUF11 domain-containing protein [Sphingobacteriales bacterium]|nr:DUF11 domain-containing protein [Sphingobacteriales bacterium]
MTWHSLNLSLLGSYRRAVGDLVTFDITISNQGDLDAANVTISDYIPAGFSLADADWTSVSASQASLAVPGIIAAGATMTVQITLQYDAIVSSAVNFAEISAATDANGNPVTDVDSTPDSTNGNDAGGNPESPSDDSINGDGSGTSGDSIAATDEDDHDPALIPLVTPGFDLALSKVLAAPAPTAVAVGDLVTFDITISNQGDLDAANVTITDYIPAGFSLADADWTSVSASQASLAVPGIIAAGTAMTVQVTLQFDDANAIGSSSVNFAEISAATDANGNPVTDVDSTPDSTNGNDAGGNPESPSDDSINGDGSGTSGDSVAATDEDDHDPALIPIQHPVDLALTKSVDDNTVSVGQTITYTITVTNEGNYTATGVTVYDALPAGLQYTGSNGAYSNVTKIWNIGTLAAGASVSLEIYAQVTAINGPITNIAEIETTNETDIDSTPGDNNDNPNVDDYDDEDDAVITPNPAPQVDLELTKSVNKVQVVNGDMITYTISVINKGPSPATGVSVYDMLPNGLTYIGSNGNYNQNTGIWTIGNLGVNETVSLQIYAQVSNITTAIVNIAEIETVNETDIDSTPGDNNGNPNVDDYDDEDDAIILPPNAPVVDLELNKSVNKTEVKVGDIITYTISVVNKGPSPATGVSVYDMLPAGLGFVFSNGSYDSNSGIWYIGNLAVNQVATLSIQAEVLSISGQIVNIAEIETVNEDDIDSTPGDNNGSPNVDDYDDEDDAVIIPDMPVVDIELLKTSNVTNVTVGTPITYTIEVWNNGPDAATGVSVYDMLPAGLQYVSASSDDYVPTTGLWYIGNLGVGQHVTLDIEAIVQSINGPIINIAEVETTNENDVDSTPGDNNGSPNVDDYDDEDSAVIYPDAAPVVDLELAKEVNQQTVSVGDVITYTITVWNNGPDAATGVSVYDMLPAGLQFIEADGDYTASTGIWYIGNVGVNQQVALHIQAKVLSINGPTKNIAEIETTNETDIDSYPGDNNGNPNVDDYDDEDDAIIVPEEEPVIDLELVKSVNAYEVEVGDIITYTITVVNKGPDAATGVSVYDMLPAGLSYEGSDGNYDPTTGIWTIGNLAVNGSVSLDIYAQVNVINGPIVNIAEIETANETDIDSYPSDNNGNPNVDDYDDEDDAVIVPAGAPIVDVELTKSVNQSEVQVGDVITYTLSVINKGPDAATGVTVYDMLPAGLQYITASSNNYNPNTGIWTIGNLAVNQEVTLDIEAQVMAINGPIVNIAEVENTNEDDIDSTPGDNNGNPNVDDYDDEDDAVVTPFTPIVDVELTKSVNQSEVQVGDVITYTLSVINKGPDAATGVTVYDMLPAGLQYITASSNNYNPNTGIWTIGNLAVNQEVTLDIEAQVMAINGPIVNIAEVENTNEDDIDSTPGDNNGNPNVDDYDDEDDAVITPEPQPAMVDVELTKSVNATTVSNGDAITYTITVVNKGPDAATGVTVYDMLPAGLSFVGSNGNYNSTTGIWTVGGLAVNQSKSLEIYAEVTNITGAIVNIAEVENTNEDDIDSTPGDNNGNPNVDDYDDEDDAVITPLPILVDLELNKSVNQTLVSVGDIITYTLTVTNEGPSAATGVSVYDVLPAGLSFVSASSNSYNSNTGIWTIGNVAVNQTISLNIQAQVTAISGPIVNIAEVETANEDDIDSTPGDNNGGPTDQDDEDSVVINPEPQPDPQVDVELTKSVNATTVSNGDAITYTITVVNKGPDAATGVTVYDMLPAGLSFVGSNGNYNSTTGIWTVGGLAVNQSKSLEIYAEVTNITGAIVNIAEVENTNEDDIDSTPGNNNGSNDVDDEDDEDDAVINPEPQPAMVDVELTKSVNATTVSNGDVITYTLTVVNKGPDAATGVTVYDMLPAGLSFIGSNGNYNNTTGIWSVGNLGVNEPKSLEIYAQVNNITSSIVNIAEVENTNEDDIDSTPGNNNGSTDVDDEDDEDDAFINPEPQPAMVDVELTKSVNTTTVSNGDVSTYTRTVVNKGPDAATGVTVYDMLPTGLSFIGSNGNYNSTNGIWSVGNLGVNEPKSLEIYAQVNNITSSIVNIAEVENTNEDDIDSTPGNNNGSTDVDDEDDEDDAVINPEPQPVVVDVELSKSVNASIVSNGDVITYTLTVVNKGPDAATGVTVYDMLPAGLSFVGSNGNYNNTTGIWTIGNLAVNQPVSLNIQAQVVSISGPIVNIAEVENTNEDDIDSTPGNNNGSSNVDDEDDEDDAVITPQSGNCDNPPVCEMDICTGPMQSVTICPEYCVAGNYTIDNIESLYQCSIQVLPNGCVLYTPLPGLEQYGSDYVTIHASSANGDCVVLFVNITVGTCNDEPNAVNDNVTADCSELTSIPVLSNDSDPNGDVLHICGYTNPAHGTLIQQVNQTFSYIPNNGFSGTDTFTYTVCDNDGGSDQATVTITIGDCNLPPVANNDNTTTSCGELVSIPVLNNDTDGDGDVLYICGNSNPQHGTVVVSGNNIIYVPNGDFSGTDSFTYTVCDGNGGSDQATVTIAVSNCNLPPVAVNDNVTADCDAIVISPLSNDSDPNGDVLTICSHSSPQHGTLVQNGNNFIYTPEEGYSGPDVFTYTICDGHGGTDVGIINIVVNCSSCINPAVYECTGIMEPIVLCPEFCEFESGYSITEINTIYGHCTIKPLSDECFRYTPVPGFEGEVDITVTACNAAGVCGTVVYHMTVSQNCDGNTNTPPVANDDSGTTPQGTPVTINVLDNDLDANGDLIYICGFTQAANGTVQQVGNHFVYTPNTGFSGTDTFTYTICDGHGGTDQATVTINVTPNCQPDLLFCTEEFTAINICLNICQPGYSISSIQNAYHCSINILGPTCFRYMPVPGYNGLDELVITLMNAQGQQLNYTVEIQVGGCNNFEGASPEKSNNNGSLINELEVPNGISPNGDAINDEFTIDGLLNAYPNADVQLTIFDQLGRTIYRSKNAEEIRWNGRLNNFGDMMPQGTYFYHLQIKQDSQMFSRTGYLELQR